MPRSYEQGTRSTGEFIHRATPEELAGVPPHRRYKKQIAIIIFVGPATGKKRIRA